MQGLWFEDQLAKLRSDIPEPRPAAGEVLVRVLAAGICNTDLELMRGYYPFVGVLGHEFVGVAEVGGGALQGQRVVGEINATCGSCRPCKIGNRTHCEQRTVLGIKNRHGAFAQYLTLPAANLLPVPEQVPTDVATFTEPVAAVLEIQEQVEIGPDQRVVVIGDGKLGLLAAQTLALTGCQLLAVGRHPEKLSILADMGIVTGIADDIEPRSFDVSVDCTGNPSGFELARRALRPRGTLVLKSTYAGKLEVDASALVVDEITLVGSRCGPFAKALSALASGNLNLGALIQARYALDQAEQAIAHASQRGVLKVLLDMSI